MRNRCLFGNQCLLCMKTHQSATRVKIIPCFHEFCGTCLERWTLERESTGRNAFCCPFCQYPLRVKPSQPYAMMPVPSLLSPLESDELRCVRAARELLEPIAGNTMYNNSVPACPPPSPIAPKNKKSQARNRKRKRTAEPSQLFDSPRIKRTKVAIFDTPAFAEEILSPPIEPEMTYPLGQDVSQIWEPVWDGVLSYEAPMTIIDACVVASTTADAVQGSPTDESFSHPDDYFSDFKACPTQDIRDLSEAEIPMYNYLDDFGMVY